jgi:LPS-assembly lipoprotein
MNKWLILLMVLLLSACGYHLRGSYDVPQELKRIYLQGGSAKLREQFKKTLEGSSGQLVHAADAKAITIKMVEGELKQRGVSLSAGGRSNEFELSYHVDYEVLDFANKVLIAREPLDIKREYFNDQQDIIAKDNEEGVIRNEMYQQAVRGMLNRIRAVLEKKPK